MAENLVGRSPGIGIYSSPPGDHRAIDDWEGGNLGMQGIVVPQGSQITITKRGCGETIQNGRHLLEGNNAPFLIIGDAPHSAYLPFVTSGRGPEGRIPSFTWPNCPMIRLANWRRTLLTRSTTRDRFISLNLPLRRE